jgi:hypothetical protein
MQQDEPWPTSNNAAAVDDALTEQKAVLGNIGLGDIIDVAKGARRSLAASPTSSAGSRPRIARCWAPRGNPAQSLCAENQAT